MDALEGNMGFSVLPEDTDMWPRKPGVEPLTFQLADDSSSCRIVYQFAFALGGGHQGCGLKSNDLDSS